MNKFAKKKSTVHSLRNFISLRIHTSYLQATKEYKIVSDCSRVMLYKVIKISVQIAFNNKRIKQTIVGKCYIKILISCANKESWNRSIFNVSLIKYGYIKISVYKLYNLYILQKYCYMSYISYIVYKNKKNVTRLHKLYMLLNKYRIICYKNKYCNISYINY